MKNIIFFLIASWIVGSCSNNKIRFVRVQRTASKTEITKKKERSFSNENKAINSNSAAQSLYSDNEIRKTDSLTVTALIPSSDKSIEETSKLTSSKNLNRSNQSKKRKYKTVHRKDKSKKQDVGLWTVLISSSLILLLGGGIFRNKERSVRISKWAKENKTSAWIAIAAIKLSLGFGGLFAGKFMYESNLHVSGGVTAAAIGMMALFAITYPKRKTTNRFLKHSYLRQKVHDVGLSVFGVLALVSLGNQSAADSQYSAPVTAIFNVVDPVNEKSAMGSKDNPYSTYESTNMAGSSEKNGDEKSSGKSTAGKVLLTILIVLGAAALLGLVALISCNLSCSGQEVAAIAVGIGGIILTVALLVLGLIWIWKKKGEVAE